MYLNYKCQCRGKQRQRQTLRLQTNHQVVVLALQSARVQICDIAPSSLGKLSGLGSLQQGGIVLDEGLLGHCALGLKGVEKFVKWHISMKGKFGDM